ncbi:MAG: hypothetical protein FJW23_06410 [Acidimicrobiia bacterium]|nr:hypothetical protein [Acidimicrobiia bacterium]
MIRLASGVLLAAVALAAIVLLEASALRLVALLVAALATRELLAVAGGPGTSPTAPLAYVYTLGVCWAASLPEPRLDVIAAGGLAVLGADVLVRARPLGTAAVGVASGLYIGFPLGALVAVHALAGHEAVILLVATVVISDSTQYYTGRLLGRHALAPAISPKKTIEGAAGGLVAGTALMAGAGPLVLPFVGRAELALAGAVVVLLGICGDLFESRLKRLAGLKDSSGLIPGHGGVLDRIDALLFAVPAFFLFVQRWL